MLRARREPSHRSSPGLVVLLATLTMIGPFTIDTIFPAFESIGADLGATPVEVQQTISVYMLTFAAASLIHGPLSDAMGRKPVILGGLLAYAAASAVCALAPTLEVLLVGRSLQGAVAGAGLVVSRTVARDIFPPELAQRALAHMTMIFGLAPAIAPIVGGWLLTWTSWRGVFGFLVGYAVLTAVWTALALPESHPQNARTPLVAKQLGSALGRALTDPAVLRLSLMIAAGFGAMFLYIASAPAIVDDLLGLGAQDFWRLFVPLVAAMITGSWVVGRVSGRVSRTRLIWAGLAVAGLGGLTQLVVVDLAHAGTLPWVLVGPVLTAFGVSVVFPVATVTLLDLRPEHRGTVSSVQAASANAVSAVVAGALSPLVSGSFQTLALAAVALTAASAMLWALHLSRGRSAPGTAPASA